MAGAEVRALAVVFLVALLTTAVAVPFVKRLSVHLGMVDRPDDRRVHDRPIPTAGGLAIVAGFLVALGVASGLDAFDELFALTSEPVGLVFGVLGVAALGWVDDRYELAPNTKLAGQVLVALVPTLFGIQIIFAWFPGVGILALNSDLGVPLTVFAIVAMINAVNFIDGLDGLAAGIAGIAAIAFLVFAVTADGQGLVDSLTPSSATLVAAIVAGACVGFLLHNFHPASIFMGDTGSMTLGLLLACSGVAYVGRTTTPTGTDFAGTVPLLVPALVLAVPFVDVAFAVVRRVWRRQPLNVADREHLHHLLLAFGHSHRRAVMVLYVWSATLAFGALGIGWSNRPAYVATMAAATIGALSLTVLGIRAGAVRAALRPAGWSAATAEPTTDDDVGHLPDDEPGEATVTSLDQRRRPSA